MPPCIQETWEGWGEGCGEGLLDFGGWKITMLLGFGHSREGEGRKFVVSGVVELESKIWKMYLTGVHACALL